MSDDAALRAQRNRGVRLRHELRKVGDRFYDPDAALLRQFSEFFPRFTGHMAAQNSLEYALLLLYSDDRTYGIDDAIEANRIIRRILDQQVLDAGAESFGNFVWMTHWDRVKDRNAVSFLTPGLVHAYLAFPDKLEDETRSGLEAAFAPALAGIRGHGALWSYTNIFMLNLASLVGLSRVLDDASVHAEAVTRFDEWLANTSEDGFHEFNSPTYTAVSLFGLEAAWAMTPDSDFRARLGRTMDVVWHQVALNTLPNGFVGGASARSYLQDILWGTGVTSAYAHVKLGTPLRRSAVEEADLPRLIRVNFTLFDYLPPRGVRELVGPADRGEIEDRTVSLGSRRANVVHPGYSLASQSVARCGGHSPPPYVVLVRDSEHQRCSVVVAPDETYSHRPCASFASRQDGSRVVGRLHLEPAEGQLEKHLADPEFVCEPRVLFGPREEIVAVRIGNVDWGGAPVRLQPGQPVALSYGELAVGVVAAPVDAAGEPAPAMLLLAYGDDGELRLHVRVFGGEDLTPEDEPIDILLLVEARMLGGPEDLLGWAEWLQSWELVPDGDGVSARNPLDPDAALSTAADGADTLGGALHRSATLTLMPGDLTRYVAGELDLPVLAR